MIHELLNEGEQNARTSKELARATRLEVRDVMQLVRLERLAGKPICSNYKGYYLPSSENDMKKTVSRLYKQARETRRVAEAMNNIRGKDK